MSIESDPFNVVQKAYGLPGFRQARRAQAAQDVMALKGTGRKTLKAMEGLRPKPKGKVQKNDPFDISKQEPEVGRHVGPNSNWVRYKGERKAVYRDRKYQAGTAAAIGGAGAAIAGVARGNTKLALGGLAAEGAGVGTALYGAHTAANRRRKKDGLKPRNAVTGRVKKSDPFGLDELAKFSVRVPKLARPPRDPVLGDAMLSGGKHAAPKVASVPKHRAPSTGQKASAGTRKVVADTKNAGFKRTVGANARVLGASTKNSFGNLSNNQKIGLGAAGTATVGGGVGYSLNRKKPSGV